MADHECNKAGDIDTLRAEQKNQSLKIDTVIRNQQEFSSDFKAAIGKLTDILVESVRHGDAINQLRKDVDALGKSVRFNEVRTDDLVTANAKFSGSGIVNRFPKVWDWYQQEKGWRRFVPAVFSLAASAAAIIALFLRFLDHGN